LLRQEDDSHQLSTSNHWHDGRGPEALEAFPVSMNEVSQPVALSGEVDRTGPGNKTINLVFVEIDSSADRIPQSFGGNYLELDWLGAIAGYRSFLDCQRSEQCVQRRLHDLVKIVSRADLDAKVGERAHAVQKLSGVHCHNIRSREELSCLAAK